MIKKLILSLLLLSCLYAQTAVAPVAGDGSEANPYQIATLENLYWISADSSNWDKHYIQTADINMSDCWNWKDSIWTGYEDYYDYYYGWIPIGNPFRGSYNGQYYIIDSLMINYNSPVNSYDNKGLFAYTFNAEITNLRLTNTSINYYVHAKNIGGLIGYSVNSIIKNCSCSGEISGGGTVGGLIGKVSNSIVKYCFTEGYTLAGWLENAGGLIGASTNSTISNCYSKTMVRISMEHGIGPILASRINSVISNCYSIGSAYDITDNRIWGISGANCFWRQWFTYPLEYTQLSYAENKRSESEMKDSEMYLEAGWDFVSETENGTEDIWDIDENCVINNGYPFLYWEYPGIICYPEFKPSNDILNQNYPNPFNVITTIGYQLPVLCNVELSIYDLYGRKINQWASQNQNTGTHEISWNGKSQNGNQAPSGVYIYSIKVGEYIESKKMVLLK